MAKSETGHRPAASRGEPAPEEAERAASEGRLLTINMGSSSLKAALYGPRRGSTETLELRAEAGGIGGSRGRLVLAGAGGETLDEGGEDLPDHAAALDALLGRLGERGIDGDDLAAVGHRIVHGGDRYREPVEITREVVSDLRDLIPMDPNHLPQAISAVEAVGAAYPAVPQVACFDTAFHRRMPPVARRYALPRELAEEGIVRYGFHGLSYEYVMGELHRVDREAAENGCVVVAHLGSGASMAAVKDGVGIDTTMGLTPTGGLVMGTRSGDLDPGVPLFLLEERGLSPSDLGELVNERAGLLGVSETSSDTQDLLEREADDPRAAEAVALFCYAAKKSLGALAAALGGLDALVFTGGVGENAAPVRERVCEGLGFLGVRLDPERNAAHAPVISRDDAAVTVRVVPTDEDLVVARHTRRLIERNEQRGD